MRGSKLDWPVFALFAVTAGCSDDDTTDPTPVPAACDSASLAFENGSAEGHADPFGARAAGQARAGRVLGADVPQPAHDKFKIEDGDYLLINEHVAAVVEGVDHSDGYGRYGGEIIAIDRVGEDGHPLGASMFVESLMLTSLYMLEPESVTVLADGSNGEAAIIRANGKLSKVPFLAETFGAIFPQQYDALPAVVDYVLEPGAEKIEVRYGIVNTSSDVEVDTGANFQGSWELLGLFQATFNQRVVPGTGYATPQGLVDFIGFDNDKVPFAYVGPDGEQLAFGGISQGGFDLYSGDGAVFPACSGETQERFEILVGEVGRGLDGLREVARRSHGNAAWSELTGIVRDSARQPVTGAFVHVTGDAGYLTRAATDAQGAYRLHIPVGETVTVVPQKRGYPASEGVQLTAETSQRDLEFAPHGSIHIHATVDGTTTPLPVRVQVIPSEMLPPTPAAFGVPDEENLRLHLEFSATGDIKLPVPPGEHRVVVSHGYEFEILDQTVDVNAGETVEIAAPLIRSVDTTGALGTDFHIHTFYSTDASDPVDLKVRSIVADGVEIACASEHEWVVDFQPRFEEHGVTDWAFGLPSLELTTLSWGHFGVVPLLPRPGEPNNGAIEWVGKKPSEVFAAVDERPEKPALIVNHPSLDNLLNAYFTASKLDRATGTSESPLWDENFDAIEVFNETGFDSNREDAVAHWFGLLNAGKTYWAVGSGDSHKVRSAPVGYPRTFLFLGYDDPKMVTHNDVRDAVKQGRATVGAGLFMTVEGPNGSAPGDTVSRGSGTVELTVTVRAPSWVAVDSLEVIVNGETVSVEPLAPVGPGPGQVFVNPITLTLPDVARSWVVFHAKGMGDLAPVQPTKASFAASNPIFFTR